VRGWVRVRLFRWEKVHFREGVRVPSMCTWSSTLGREWMKGLSVLAMCSRSERRLAMERAPSTLAIAMYLLRQM
jgi:hypothetical protein